MIKLDYDELNAELVAVQAGIRAAECHGFLCGCFCISNTLIQESWQDHLLVDIDNNTDLDDCIAMLSQLAKQVIDDILSEEIAFNLFLPDDETSIVERSDALAEWCVGFISGLGIGGLKEGDEIKDECDEFIKDVISISRMEAVEEESNEMESYLSEIIEYTRVGVIMLHQEWHQETDNEQPRVLH